MARQPAHGRRPLDRGLDGLRGFGRPALAHMGDRLTIIGIAYRDDGLGVMPPAADKKWTSFYQWTRSARGEMLLHRFE
ncbi:MAG: hypothetical protein AMXMBFR67_33640 [Nitrospira sp.]